MFSTASSSASGFIIRAGIVLVAAAAFASTLLLISDLDQPYAGALRREPTQTEFVRDQIAVEVRARCRATAPAYRPTPPPSAQPQPPSARRAKRKPFI